MVIFLYLYIIFYIYTYCNILMLLTYCTYCNTLMLLKFIGEQTFKPVSFKNTGTVAFTYEWNVLLDKESSNPPDLTAINNLIEENSLNNLLPREHYLQSRSNIFCMKSKGKILPGETVRTLFVFNNNCTVGAVTEAWELNTIPRANIAMDGDRDGDRGGNSDGDRGGKNSVNSKANKLHPLLLSALTASTQVFQESRKPAEYDMLTPLQICIRGHIKEIDDTIFSRQNTINKIQADILNVDINDSKQLISRRIREPIKIQHIKARKIKIFEKINSELFETLGGTYVTAMPLVITVERMKLFENICDQVYIELPEARNKLFEIENKAKDLFQNIPQKNVPQTKNVPVDLKDILINRNPKELKRMFLELFPERKIVRFYPNKNCRLFCFFEEY